MNYYCIYDKSLQQANLPFAASDDQSAVRMVRNMLLSATDDVFERVLPVCDLRYVGAFDEVEAKFKSADSNRILCDLSSIPIPSDDGGSE
jgi:hypothetical protein